ncbi:MAG TPA: methylated-DNA--[protein]-cysteine S-methyltransferase [Candidatus Omnitrophota bacterium]|nr:methylated-DNA--[protein]-cysteine S-methyltransferase [Candidatus Omnitrophota bacterium]HRZ14760.1 methylated-DNA--[protein]-cysteine S-methyltransferase [Candidatus Omnitrophota bacterium]
MKKTIIKPACFGPVAVIWSQNHDLPHIIRVLLSRPGFSAEEQAAELYPDASTASCAQIDALIARIKSFLAGEKVRFSLQGLRWQQCSAFQQAVLRAEYRIPRGSVSTYGRIAEHIGKNDAARAVGAALATNPFPLIIPCHRAIRSDGYPGGFQGGSEMKRALLEQEGIVFDDRGRVSGARFHFSL